MAADFPNHRVLIAASAAQSSRTAFLLPDRIVLPYDPRLVVVDAGGKDIKRGAKHPGGFFAAFQAFMEKVRAPMPVAEIAYIVIAGNPKRWAQIEQVKAANAMIASGSG